MTKQMKFGLVMLATAVLSVASLVNAKGWVQNGADWFYVNNDGEYVTETIQTSGNSKFYLGEDGAMQRDFFLEDYNGNAYYFGSNGAMVTNTWVAIDSSIVENQPDYLPDALWYYFGSNGKAVKGKGTYKPTTIDGRKYIFNENGQMCTGWVKADGGSVDPDAETNPFSEADYYCGGDNDGVVRTGWVSYYDSYDDDEGWKTDIDTIYFYFNLKNGKKTKASDGTGAKTLNINGRTYAFSDEGIMFSGWQAYENTTKWTEPRYFSGEDDGHMVKKGWVYAVPGEQIDSKAHEEDDEKYMYFKNNGAMYQDIMKKINGKFYVFNPNGIMKTGVVLWSVEPGTDKDSNPNVHYMATIDLDNAEGSEMMKKGRIQVGESDTDVVMVDWAGVVIQTNNADKKYETNDDYIGFKDNHVKLHLFGSDGAKKIGANQVEFSDNTYTFNSKNTGNYDSGVFKKKYYSMGLLCAADPDIKFGLFTNVEANLYKAQSAASATTAGSPSIYSLSCNGAIGRNQVNGYAVLNTTGAKVKGATAAKKDADGNYWLLNANTGYLIGIYSVNIKYYTGSIKFKSQFDVLAGTNVTSINDLRTKSVLKSAGTQKFEDAECTQGGNLDEQFKDPTGQDDGFRVSSMKFASVSKTSNYTYCTLKGTGYWYQSDYDGKSNVWLPVGVTDQAGYTAHVFDYDPYDSNGVTSQSYSILPDDSYFLSS